jgi:hypothetical protein
LKPFQTLTLEYQSWFQNVPFKCNLRRYAAGGNIFFLNASGALHNGGGAVQVDFSWTHSLKAPGFFNP